jgi:hypothetical protein
MGVAYNEDFITATKTVATVNFLMQNIMENHSIK